MDAHQLAVPAHRSSEITAHRGCLTGCDPRSALKLNSVDVRYILTDDDQPATRLPRLDHYGVGLSAGFLRHLAPLTHGCSTVMVVAPGVCAHAKTGAAYVPLINHGSSADKLLSATGTGVEGVTALYDLLIFVPFTQPAPDRNCYK